LTLPHRPAECLNSAGLVRRDDGLTGVMPKPLAFAPANPGPDGTSLHASGDELVCGGGGSSGLSLLCIAIEVQ